MRLGRRKAIQWLSPMRQALRDIRSTGETLVDEDDRPLIEMPDAYVRSDHCIEGFVRMIARVLPNTSITAVERIRNKLANDEPMTAAQLDAALAEINAIEPLIARVECNEIKAAVQAEKAAIAEDERQ